MSKGNGHAEVQILSPTTTQLVEILVEAVRQLTEKVENLQEQNGEILEKLNNLNTPGLDYDFLDATEN